MFFKSYFSRKLPRYSAIKNTIFGWEWVDNERLQDIVYKLDEVKSVNDEQDLLLEFIEGKELARILKVRAVERQPNRLAFGSPDFLPFMFLENGFRCGAAVCLLRRTFSDSEIDELIDGMEVSTTYPTEILSQLLNIEQGFWRGSKYVADALAQNSELRGELKAKIENYNPIPVGTGFLVGINHLLTNNHIVSDINIVQNFVAEFDPKVNSYSKLPPIRYQLDPSLFQTDPSLDYTLVKLKPLTKEEKNKQKSSLTFNEAGNNFGWIPISKEDTVIAPPVPLLNDRPIQGLRLFLKQLFQAISPQDRSEIIGLEWSRLLRGDDEFLKELEQVDGNLSESLKKTGLLGEPVNIIQHPKGGKKQIVIYNNRVQNLRENFLQYETDAEPGSSGSPLFNTQWQLVGIHHSALVDNKSGEILGYLGTRACRIAEDLRKYKLSELENKISKAEDDESKVGLEAEVRELSIFLNEYVDDNRKGKVFISAGRLREEKLGQEHAAIEAGITNKLAELACNIINSSTDFRAVHIQRDSSFTNQGCKSLNDQDLDPAVCWLRDTKDEYRPGDVAIEILLDKELGDEDLDPVNYNLRGAKVYYIGNWMERKLQAEVLLRDLMLKVSEKDPAFISQGAQPDTVVGGLRFCRNVPMPSLVLYLGYVTSERDLQLLRDQSALFAEGLANGLRSWVSALSPVRRF